MPKPPVPELGTGVCRLPQRTHPKRCCWQDAFSPEAEEAAATAERAPHAYSAWQHKLPAVSCSPQCTAYPLQPHLTQEAARR
mmetsp:Transcript_9523/g.25688  ORF Transcript_9523/g.25688 Transcript_9523/m.25688 type:complete len:82 (-) Transcript_9523:639-884(-)